MTQKLFRPSIQDQARRELPVIIEHQNGQCEDLQEVTVTMGLLVHEASRQAFPLVEPMERYTLSLDGDYTEFDGDVYYFDDELGDPNAEEAVVHGAAIAACEAAEAGEYEDPAAVKVNAWLQLLAAVGGIGFLLLVTIVALVVLTDVF